MATIASPLSVSSTSDMMSIVPSDLFAGPDIPEPESAGDDDTHVEAAPDTTIEIAGDDAPQEASPTPAETAAEVAAKAEEQKAAEAKPAEATEEELPEGVRKGKDRKGKDGYFLEENRYQTFHGNHKLVQQGAQIMGEPLTAEALTLRNDAYLGQERLFNNLTSGDPVAQGDVLKFIFNEMKGARENGEVGIDPAIPFAETMYQTLQAEAPDAYSHLRHVAARDLLTEMYEQGATAGDLHLISSAQRIGLTLAGIPAKPEGMPEETYLGYVKDALKQADLPFHTIKESQGLARVPEDVSARLARENAELKAQLNGRSTTGTAAQFETWSQSNIKDVNAAIFNDAVKPALASVEEGWKEFPDDYRRLVTEPLHREVLAAVKADEKFDDLIKGYQERAKRAVSEQVRTQLGSTIRQLFVNRAKQAAELKAPPILSFAAKWLQGRSTQNHERRTSAQAHTVPKGPSAPVKQSLAPATVGFKDGIYDPAIAMKQMLALVNA